MKSVLILIVTFIVAFATSALFEIEFFSKNPVRYVMVVLLIIIEFIFAFIYLLDELKKSIQKIKQY